MEAKTKSVFNILRKKKNVIFEKVVL